MKGILYFLYLFRKEVFTKAKENSFDSSLLLTTLKFHSYPSGKRISLLETLDDNTLMLKVKAGDLDRLGLLFERYHRMLFQFFYNIHRDKRASEDMVQNVFVRLLKYRNRFRGDGAFKQWIFSIARNVSHDYYKKNIRHQSEDLETWASVLPDHQQHQSFVQKEENQLLQIALQKLDPKKRELLTLSKLEGWRHQEIAELLGYSQGSIKVLIFRAVQELKKEYLLLTKV